MTTVRVPIDIRSPSVATLAGNSYFNVLGLTNYDGGVWDFVKSVDGIVNGFVTVPHSINATPNASIILSCGANATSGVANFAVRAKNVSTAPNSYNVTFATPETHQSFTAATTAYNRYDLTFALTNMGAPAADDEIVLQILHAGANTTTWGVAYSGDTIAADPLLFDAWLQVDL